MHFEITKKGLELGFSIEVNSHTERTEILMNGVSIEELKTPLSVGELQAENILTLKKTT